MTTTNPRPRPALSKAPGGTHPAAIDEPAPTKPVSKPAPEKAVAKPAAKPADSKKSRGKKLHLGEGSTSDTLRGKKKQKNSTLRADETVDFTIELPKSLRKRLRTAAKAADVSVDDYLQALLDSALP